MVLAARASGPTARSSPASRRCSSYKTRVALEKPCKECAGIVIGQLEDGRRSASFAVVSDLADDPGVRRKVWHRRPARGQSE